MKRPIISRDFDPDIAKEVGTDAAIIFQNIWFWVNHNRSAGKEEHYHEGKWWTYNSIKGFHELFYYLPERKIGRELDKLKESGYLITGNFNQNSYDRTLWYTIGQKWEMDLPKTVNGIDENGKSTTTYDKPDYNLNEPFVNKEKQKDLNLNGMSLKELRPLLNGPNHQAVKEEIKRRKEKSPIFGKKAFNRYTNPPTTDVGTALSPGLGIGEITPEILKEVTKETKTYLEDVETAFGQMCARIRSGEMKAWNNAKDQLISWILGGIKNGYIEKKKTLEERIIEQYGPILE